MSRSCKLWRKIPINLILLSSFFNSQYFTLYRGSFFFVQIAPAPDTTTMSSHRERSTEPFLSQNNNIPFFPGLVIRTLKRVYLWVTMKKRTFMIRQILKFPFSMGWTEGEVKNLIMFMIIWRRGRGKKRGHHSHIQKMMKINLFIKQSTPPAHALLPMG